MRNVWTEDELKKHIREHWIYRNTRTESREIVYCGVKILRSMRAACELGKDSMFAEMYAAFSNDPDPPVKMIWNYPPPIPEAM